LGSILLAALYLFFQLSLITAVAIGLGVFTSSVLATLLSFGVYLMGNFSQDLVELGRLSRNPGFQRLTQGLYLSCLISIRPEKSGCLWLRAFAKPTHTHCQRWLWIAYTVLVLAIAILISRAVSFNTRC